MGKTVKPDRAAREKRALAAGRVRKHRARMKAAGLKPVTIWVPDVNSPEFKAQIAREIELVNAHEDGTRVMEDMLALADFSEWK